MDIQAVTTQNRIAQTAPPPPVRRRIHVPAEPLLFAAVILMLTIGIAKTMSQHAGVAADITGQPAAKQQTTST